MSKTLDITKDEKIFYNINTMIETEKNSYQITERLGAGGNGVVYECLDFEGESYAIKIQLNISPVAVKRFKQEIKLMKSINHPNLIRYIDSGDISAYKLQKDKKIEVTLPFLIMEKAEENLRNYIAEGNRPTYSEYITQFMGLSEALAKVHKEAIHRDIKLENILVIGDRWVLSDFGLCSFIDEEEHEDLTKIHEKIGPKYWMSPEALNRIYNNVDEIIPASDVFQLAAIFWYVVNQRFPFGIVEDDDWSTDDTETCHVLLKCLSNNGKKRIQNGEELYLALSAVVEKYKTMDLSN